jgi:hypothetical protein
MLTFSSPRKAVKSPMALHPPPTHATSVSGSFPPVSSLNCSFASRPDDGLEIADHHRERVGTDDGSDGVELRHRVLHVGAERGVHGLFEGLEAVRGGDDVGS